MTRRNGCAGASLQPERTVLAACQGGRRIRKVVTNSGDFDGTIVYLYNRNQIIETRDP